MKQQIRLNESQLRKIVKETVTQMLNEVSPQMAAAYANGRQQQANGQLPLSQSQQRMGNTQQDMESKANQGVKTAQDKWNKQFGYNFDNGNGNYGYQRMGGEQFVNNGNNPYGISGKYGNNGKTTNMAYNPSTNKEWTGNGDGTSQTVDSSIERELGDNGAYRTARQMANAKWPSRQQ